MLTIAYVSTATRELLEDGFTHLLLFIREKNRALDISGMLLYCDQGLMQVLEGPEDVVRPLYDTIQGDSRHEQVALVFEESTQERRFGETSMAMRQVTRRELEQVSGWTDLRQAIDGDELANRERAYHLLKTFHDAMT